MTARRNGYAETARRAQVRNSSIYIYGNTVRQTAAQPRRWEEQPAYEPKRKKAPSRQVRINRRRALRMNPAYVAFLSLAAVIVLASCVWYLQIRAELTTRSEHVTQLQQELADRREENTTRYNAVMDSVNLEDVRERAVNEMGMYYADSTQIITYQNPIGDYVKQYQSIPESGVLAQSDKVER